MTDRTLYLFGAAGIAAGAAIMLLTQDPGASGLTWLAYLVVQGVVWRWGLQVYGATGGLAALWLSACAAPLLGAAGLGAAAAWVLSAYVTARCLRDPSLQWALAIGLAGLAAMVMSGRPALLPSLLGYALLLALLRTATAERCEPRGRVLHGALAATLIGWALLAALGWLIGRIAPLPAVDDFSAAPHAWRLAAASAADAMPGGGIAWLCAPLLLVLLRPWRRQRRYSDGAWLLAMLCVLLARARSAAPHDVELSAVLPFAALLGGAAWDADCAGWRRRLAAALLALHVLLSANAALQLRQTRPAAAPVRPA
jgi:hypothetical protein